MTDKPKPTFNIPYVHKCDTCGVAFKSFRKLMDHCNSFDFPHTPHNDLEDWRKVIMNVPM